jgi:hypothetical protein
MQIQTIDGSTIAKVDGTWEDAYKVAMRLWDVAGTPGVTMAALVIVYDDPDDGQPFRIDYTTHER